MKKVKKLAVIVSAGILALSLAACNGENSGSGEAKTEETETSMQLRMSPQRNLTQKIFWIRRR